MLSGAVIEGLAILKGADDDTAQKLRDQHNAGHDMTKWVSPRKTEEQVKCLKPSNGHERAVHQESTAQGKRVIPRE